MTLDAVLQAMQANPLTQLRKEDVVEMYVNPMEPDNLSPDEQERQFKDDYMDLINDDDYEL